MCVKTFTYLQVCSPKSLFYRFQKVPNMCDGFKTSFSFMHAYELGFCWSPLVEKTQEMYKYCSVSLERGMHRSVFPIQIDNNSFGFDMWKNV